MDRRTEHVKSTRVLWSNIAVLIASWLLWDPFQHAVDTYFQVYLAELGMTPSAISTMFGLGTLTLTVASVLGGHLADVVGRKRLIVPLTYCVALCYLLYHLTSDVCLIFLIFVLYNAFLMYIPALDAIVADSIPEERRGLGYAVTSLSAVGLIVGPFIALHVLKSHSENLVSAERSLFLLAFISGLLAATIRLIGLKETLPETKRMPLISSVFSEYRRALTYVVTRMRTYLACRVLFSAIFGLTMLAQYYAILYLRLRYETWALALMLGNLAGYVVSPLAGVITDKVGRRTAIALGFVCVCVSTFLLAMTPVGDPAYVLAAMVFEGLSWGVAWIGFMAMFADLVPQELRGKGSALLSLVCDASLSVGSVLCGVLYEGVGPRAPFWVAFFSSLAGLLLSPLLEETLRG